jgi:hypothetical protein
MFISTKEFWRILLLYCYPTSSHVVPPTAEHFPIVSQFFLFSIDSGPCTVLPVIGSQLFKTCGPQDFELVPKADNSRRRLTPFE